MRIRFILLYFFWNSVIVAEEISRTLLLEHHTFRNHSAGIGFSKENQKNKSLLGWIHFGNSFSSSLNYNLQISYLNQKREILKTFPNTESIYGIEKQTKQLITVSPGINFKYFSIYPSFNSENPSISGVSFGLNLFPEKSLFFFYRRNLEEDTRSYSLSILSGVNPGIGLLVAKEYLPEKVEWSGSISLSFQFESYQGGGIYYTENKREENTLFISKIFEENKNSIFENEINPLEVEKIEQEKQEIFPEKKKFHKKEKIIYEIKIEELLKFRIPLVIAIRISRASKSKEEYNELLKNLPPDIVRKCNKIQFDKRKANP